MLVLSRKESEKVMIGEGITVSILNVKGKNVKLGFDAPKEVEINREEIFKRKVKEKNKKEAA